jgi:hypothetical protein
MSSTSDLISPLGRAPAATPASTSAPTQKPKNLTDVPPLPSLEDSAGGNAAFAAIKPISAAGASLDGLQAPQPIDPTKAGLNLVSVDALRAALGRAVAPVQAHTPNAMIKTLPAFGGARRLKPTEPALAPNEIKELAGALTDRLRATSAPLLAAVAAAGPDARQPERAGIIASFILNAAMSPGWPPPAALDAGAACESVAVLQEMDEGELLEYVAALGGDGVLLARLTMACSDSDWRMKLLRAIAFLVTLFGALVTALRAEIEEILHDFELVKSGEAPEAWAGRIRLPLK